MALSELYTDNSLILRLSSLFKQGRSFVYTFLWGFLRTIKFHMFRVLSIIILADGHYVRFQEFRFRISYRIAVPLICLLTNVFTLKYDLARK